MSDAVQQIKEKINIIDVVSPYVELHKAGKNFKGKSPFSSEKTPSFYVSPDRGMYYCFSTSQGGDIFNFVQAMEGVDFKGALQILADKAGVELVPEDPKKRSERDRLYAALEAATLFYQEWLERESVATAYLERRGVKPETIARWKIGYAPGPPRHGWRHVKESLEQAGHTKEVLFKAGLIKNSVGGKAPFDVFRDRVMFPMADASGRVVAFSGRLLSTDTDAPKYVNSPETELYKKSELLFGYDKARNGIRNLNFSLIVEGQFDVVMSHQAGYNNAVAVSGTALTIHHVQLLERLSDRVVLALDADRAGINAMKKGAALMLARGLDVKVAELPLGKDPADMIMADQHAFKQVIGKSVHVIEFLLHVLRREITDDRSFKLKTRTEVLPFILLLPNRIDQEHFVEKVARAIGTTIDAVRFELDRLREQAQKEPERQPVVQDAGVVTSDAAAKEGIDLAQKAYIYLRAVERVVQGKLQARLQIELTALHCLTKLVEPQEADLSGIVFMLEQQFADATEQVITEEVVAKLNQFKQNAIRKQLAMYRQLLQSPQFNDEQMVDVLEHIKEYEARLREPAYDPETFVKEVKKD